MKILQHSIALFFAIIFTGCASPKAWTYSADAPIERSPLINQSITVPPLIDKRPTENDDRLMLYMVPLMPYSWANLNSPEGVQHHLTSGLWQFKPTEDIAKAVAAELSNRRLFKEAFFSYRESEGDFVLRGTLSATKYEGTLYSYGLSFAAPYLWFLGLPCGSVENVFTLNLRLEDRSSNKAIWEKSYSAEHKTGVFWLYNRPSDFWYDAMLKELMPSILSELEEAVKKAGLSSQMNPSQQSVN